MASGLNLDQVYRLKINPDGSPPDIKDNGATKNGVVPSSGASMPRIGFLPVKYWVGILVALIVIRVIYELSD